MTKKYEEIKTPLELLDFIMKNFEYGYLGKNNKVYKLDNPKFNECWENNYVLEDTDDMLNTLVGNCYDQVEFARKWFTDNGYEVKTYYEMVVVDYRNPYPTHSFLVYKDKNKWNWFEYADSPNMGIHSFDSLEECLSCQLNKYIKFLNDFNISDKEKENIKLYEFCAPPRHIGAREYIDFCLNGKEIIYDELEEIKRK